MGRPQMRATRGCYLPRKMKWFGSQEKRRNILSRFLWENIMFCRILEYLQVLHVTVDD